MTPPTPSRRKGGCTHICPDKGCILADLQTKLQQAQGAGAALSGKLLEAVALGEQAQEERDRVKREWGRDIEMFRGIRQERDERKAERDAAIERERYATHLGLRMLRGYCEALTRAEAAEATLRGQNEQWQACVRWEKDRADLAEEKLAVLERRYRQLNKHSKAMRATAEEQRARAEWHGNALVLAYANIGQENWARMTDRAKNTIINNIQMAEALRAEHRTPQSGEVRA